MPYAVFNLLCLLPEQCADLVGRSGDERGPNSSRSLGRRKLEQLKMNSRRQNPRPRNGESGMTIVEMMIAIAVLLVGMVVSLIFITVAMGSNFRNRQGSNSTAMSQMMVEKIMSVGANVSPTLTINDCAGNAHTIN